MRKTAKMAAFANRSRDQIVAANAESRTTMEILEMNLANVRTLNASTAFVNWSENLKRSSKGVVRMYSCSAGQGADEDPDSGGFYTSLLLEGAESWVKTQNYANIFSTLEAHVYAKAKLPRQQVPEYSPINLAFPFAAK